jgi:hypothetical protein
MMMDKVTRMCKRRIRGPTEGTVPEMRDHQDEWQDSHTSQFRTTSEHFPPVKTKDKMSLHPHWK